MDLPKVYSKLYSYEMLEKDPKLADYLLPTEAYDWGRCKQWAKKFGMVFIKPEYNNGGKGIIRIRALEADLWEISSKANSIISSFASLESKLNLLLIPHKTYVIQKGISLAKVKGSVIDFRVFSQNINGIWTCPGMVAKVANGRQFITNLNNGGKALPVTEVFSHLGISKKEQKERMQQMAQMANRVGITYHQEYPNLKEVALDIGLSDDLQFYIIEVNTHFPGTVLFQSLKDKTMFRRIWANRRKMGEWRNFPELKKFNLRKL